MTEVVVHADAEALAGALAAAVAEDLGAALAGRGRAAIAVPGGTTPARFLELLGGEDLDWARIAVTLTDERWVSASDPRSNHGLVERTLLAGRATQAWFVPLYGGPTRPGDTLGVIADVLERDVLPLDVVVAGMGEDMHTASLFPDAPGLAEALEPPGGRSVALVEPDGVPETRITLTAPVLAAAARRYILITGAAKQRALARAEAAAGPYEAPVRVLLDAGATVYYAP